MLRSLCETPGWHFAGLAYREGNSAGLDPTQLQERKNQMTNQESSPPVSEEISRLSRIVAGRFLFLGILMFVALFWAAGQLDWWEGWAYIIASLLTLIVGRFYLIYTAPDQIAERMEAPQKENVKPWERILVPVIAMLGPLAAWIVAGLDVRYGWSPDLPLYIQIIALTVLFSGAVFSNWSMIVNRFYSSHVRIQTDRGHSVISSGPYSVLRRHPGYAGDILAWIAVPFFFSSYWVVIPCITVILAYIVRITLEDRTLQEELPGYKEYASRVRYRLLPGIW
jgi:protein-S-isoprenylcysteine O-methyltransferase Ste14